MAERLPQKIAALALAALFAAGSADAAEKFVPYSEARAQLEQKPGAGAGSVSPEELEASQRQGTPVRLFDARTKNEFDREHIAGAVLPYDEAYYRDLELYRQRVAPNPPDVRSSLERSTRGLLREEVIVTYCSRHCGLSRSLKMQLEKLGFTNVRWLDGGIDVWREKGYPVEKS